MKLSSLKIDPEKFEQGAWVNDIPDMGDLRLRVRGIGNSDYRRLQAALLETIPRSKRMRGKIDTEEQDRVLATCLHQTVLLDWEGILDDDGKLVLYSKEMAKTLLTDPAYVAFRGAVSWAASVVADRDTEAVQDIVGNSPPLSAGQ